MKTPIGTRQRDSSNMSLIRSNSGPMSNAPAIDANPIQMYTYHRHFRGVAGRPDFHGWKRRVNYTDIDALQQQSWFSVIKVSLCQKNIELA